MNLRISSPAICEEAITSATKTLRSGNLVQGEQVSLFERELAHYLQVPHAIVVSSGTAALHLSLLALEIGPGDAVIVPDFTFPATANVVSFVGAEPVIVDVRPDSYCMCNKSLRDVIETWSCPQEIKGIIPVHQFGHAADMDEIVAVAKEYNLALIEDAACALGGRFGKRALGTIGDIGCFSFHARKILTTGEGGLLVTDDETIADSVRRLRNHGMSFAEGKAQFTSPGLNYRMTDFQAAIGRQQLRLHDEALSRRRALVQKYVELLTPLISSGFICLPNGGGSGCWQTFMISLSANCNRDAVISEMKERGIECGIGAHSLSGLSHFGAQSRSSIGLRLSVTGLALPLSENYDNKDVEFVCGELSRILKTKTL